MIRLAQNDEHKPIYIITNQGPQLCRFLSTDGALRAARKLGDKASHATCRYPTSTLTARLQRFVQWVTQTDAEFAKKHAAATPADPVTSPLIPVSLNGGEPTMSSREIAELTGKRHDNVLRDARAMLIELYGRNDLLRFEGVYSGANGEERPCLNLPKRETLILVSGYNIQMRARIIDRWQELEARQATNQPVNYRDPAVLLGVLTELQNQVTEAHSRIGQQAVVIDHQAGRIVEMQPKEQFFDSYVRSDGLYTLSDGARLLSDKPNIFLRTLRNSGYLFYNGRGDQVPYAAWRQKGFFDVKVTPYQESGARVNREQIPRIFHESMSHVPAPFCIVVRSS